MIAFAALDRPRGVEGTARDLSTTLSLHHAAASELRCAPVTTGIPWPRGALHKPGEVELFDGSQRIPHQARTLARWPDGSIQWLLVDFVARNLVPGSTQLAVRIARLHSQATAETSHDRQKAIADRVGSVSSRSQIAVDPPLPCDRDPLTLARQVDFVLTTHGGRRVQPRIERTTWLVRGPVRTTLQIEGCFPRSRGLRFLARISEFCGTGLVRIDVRLHNPNRARHRGGLWDLGDPGSILFRAFHLEARAPQAASEGETTWCVAPGSTPQSHPTGPVAIVQTTSGGPAANGPNHIDSRGRVPERRFGYAVLGPREAAGERALLDDGLRANPWMAIGTEDGALGMTIPEFWQQFPKSLERDADMLRAGLFPHLDQELHELQGGEQKTHTVWLARDEEVETLSLIGTPVRTTLPPEWHAAAGLPGCVSPADHVADSRLDAFLRGALSGELSPAARRDRIDEYGWRSFGDMPADHEQEFYPGTEPIVSHYNNQFDLVFGGIAQLARTGDPRWFELFDPLARHVIDIDVYHTRRDRAAYNGGLFWHTDHFRTAGTATHRAYSRVNAPDGGVYGGGPGCEHNYTSGLLQYHYLTGNPDAAQAVVSLADWVLAMDDGRQSFLGILDAGPTGLATATAEPGYHGPGRGAGNSLNALVDAWRLTRDRRYFDGAERIVRRVVHPEDDVAALNLLNAELRWSYTVFLVALSKWLDVKANEGELDGGYAWGQASLLHFARWMAANERPYFDRPEELEYPTAAWAAQELRKANVLRLAARHANEPDRTRFADRGNELAERAWSDLERFDNRHSARCLSILMTEGAREAWLRAAPPAPRVQRPTSWPPRERFLPQKERIRLRLKSPRGAVRLALRMLNVVAWPRTIRLFLKHL